MRISRSTVVAAAVCTVMLQAAAGLTAIASGVGPQLDAVTFVNGDDQSWHPGADIAANLDTTPMLAGTTRYDPDGLGPHLVFNDTSASFLWRQMPADSDGLMPGQMHVFTVHPDSLYFTPSRYVPTAIADNQTVVGSVAFLEQRVTEPWESTATGDLNFLPLPDSTWQGSARDISRDGHMIAGSIFQGFGRVEHAVTWVNGTRRELAGSDAWSQADAISLDGSVVIGSSGPDSASQQAARWVNGQLVVLEPVAGSSTALFTSDDGGVPVGTATYSPASTALVRWSATGQAQVLTPPDGYSVDRVTAINPDASAVVGALVQYIGCTPGGPGPICQGNDVPFLWTAGGGFTLLPEDGNGAFFDLSTAVDVSDDGSTVVGELSSSVSFDGAPHPTAFVWTAASGERQLNTLTSAAGYNFDLFGVTAISGTGKRIVAFGDVSPITDHDTHSVILDVSGLQ